jgi:hypothetical protein
MSRVQTIKPLGWAGSILSLLLAATIIRWTYYAFIPAYVARTGQPYWVGYLWGWVSNMVLVSAVALIAYRAANGDVGSYDESVHYPLAEARDPGDLAAHRWPCTAWFDYSVLPARIAALQSGGERCLMVANGNLFETAWYMRGLERAFLDVALRPELFHAIMAQVTDFHLDHFQRILSAADGAVDLAFTAGDISGQQGFLLSLDIWEQHLKPYHVRLNQAIHGFGVKAIYHTDGAAMEAVEARSGSTRGSTSCRRCSSAPRGWTRES